MILRNWRMENRSSLKFKLKNLMEKVFNFLDLISSILIKFYFEDFGWTKFYVFLKTHKMKKTKK